MRCLPVALAFLVVSCSPTTPCSPATCATGCCSASGACESGSQSSACGARGDRCQTCSLGQSCASGRCEVSLGGQGSGSSGTGGGLSAGGGASAAGGTSAGGVAGAGGGTGGGSGAVTSGGTSGPGVDCTSVVTEVRGSGGCVISLVGPSNCDAVSFAQGFVEFAWTTNGTFCEGPHRFFIGGHPASTWEPDNALLFSLTSTDGNERSIEGMSSTYSMVRNIGGYVHLRQSDLAVLSTTTGQYHWLVAGFYDVSAGGSRSESRVFTIR